MMKLNNVLSWLKDINIQNADAVKPKPEDKRRITSSPKSKFAKPRKGGGGGGGSQIKI